MADTETKDLGVVTAYGEACEAGYTGTYDEFCTMLANLNSAESNAKEYAERAEKAYQQTQTVSNVDVMKGATADEAGTGGLTPTPPAGSQNQYLGGDAKYHDIFMDVRSEDLAGSTIQLYNADKTEKKYPKTTAESVYMTPDGTETLNDKLDSITKNVKTMTGATSDTAGTAGLAPAPSAGDQDKALFGDGTYREIPLGLYFTELASS